MHNFFISQLHFVIKIYPKIVIYICTYGFAKPLFYLFGGKLLLTLFRIFLKTKMQNFLFRDTEIEI